MKISALRRLAGVALAATAALTLAACTAPAGAVDEAPVVDAVATEEAPVADEAGTDWEWTRDRDYFVIGYLPMDDTPHFATAQAGMRDALTEVLDGREVREMHVSDPTAMIEAIRLGEIDMGIVGATAVVDAYERAGALPVATMIRPSIGNIHSSVFVRADSDIYTLADLEGRSFAFVDAISTTGTLLPSLAIMEAFPELNLTMGDLLASGPFFSEAVLAGSHAAAVRAVILGDTDAGGAASPQLATVLTEEGLPLDYLREIHASGEQIGATVVVSADLDPALAAALQAMLLDFDNEDFFIGMWNAEDGRFFTIAIEDFAEVKAMIAVRDAN